MAVDVPLLVGESPNGVLRISSLPQQGEQEDLLDDGLRPSVREARSYRFELELADEVTRVEPSELFDFDDDTRRTGRLLPRESVGVVTVEVHSVNGCVRTGRFEVRAAKFGDAEAFGQMLADLAALAVESLHQGFAPSAGTFGTAMGASPRLLFQQFAVLRGLLRGSDLSWAMAHLLARPHRSWESHLDASPPGRPLRGSSRLSTQLGRPGARVATLRGPLPSLPARLLVERAAETIDTVPNQFVKFIFERWRALSISVLESATSLSGAPRRRAVDEATHVRDQLDEALGQPLFSEVSRLSVFPGDNQVLRRREGYRQIAAAAALIDGSLGLSVDLDDPLLVSRRSIATLYEYWTFVRLARAVGNALNGAATTGNLFHSSRNGMSLVLNADDTTRLRFIGATGSTHVEADLLFNHEFRAGESWTRPMRPDASLGLQVAGRPIVWLHFDAKYRVDWSGKFDTGPTLAEEEAERHGTSKRTDLLKMHAYKDAIRSSAGSYVLFPGSDEVSFEYDRPSPDREPLPGLGALPMRPDQADADTARIEAFLRQVIAHVAGTGTKHRRADYWAGAAYAGRGSSDERSSAPVGALPPADTAVLLGYVRSDAQWDWLERNRLYNVRAGDRSGAVDTDEPELAARLIVCYGPRRSPRPSRLFERVGGWRAASRDQMIALGYPDPRGEAYLIARLAPLETPEWLGLVDVATLAPSAFRFGTPFIANWLDVVLAAVGS